MTPHYKPAQRISAKMLDAIERNNRQYERERREARVAQITASYPTKQAAWLENVIQTKQTVQTPRRELSYLGECVKQDYLAKDRRNY